MPQELHSEFQIIKIWSLRHVLLQDKDNPYVQQGLHLEYKKTKMWSLKLLALQKK